MSSRTGAGSLHFPATDDGRWQWDCRWGAAAQATRGEGPLAPGVHRLGHWGAAAAATRLRKGTLPSAHWRPEAGAADLRPGRPDRQGQGRESRRRRGRDWAGGQPAARRRRQNRGGWGGDWIWMGASHWALGPDWV
jgi:hypothetical protein